MNCLTKTKTPSVTQTGRVSERQTIRVFRTQVSDPVNANEQLIVAEIFRASYLGFWHRLEGRVVHAIELYVINPNTVDGDPHGDNITKMAEAEAIKYILAGKGSLEFFDPASIRDIRINSLIILKAIHEVDFSMPSDECPLVFYSPFLALVETYEPMKLLLEEVQRKACAEGYEGQQEVINHLSCFMRLMETGILPIHHRLSDSKSDAEVRFWELYYLFGDEEDLYHPATTDTLAERSSHHQHIWRVVPRNGLAWRASQPGTLGGFVELTCYHLGFDGHSYFPVHQTFGINAFQGHRLVTSLPIYPIRFALNASQILRESREAGLKFIEAVKETQKWYHGWTLRLQGERKDDREFVSSNVIVDCAEAFKAQSDLRPKAAVIPETSEEKWEKRDWVLSIWRRKPGSGRLHNVKKKE
jgi:hypothetical protein